MSNKTNIEQSVLEKIRSGRISMRPRVYFALRLAFLILVAGLALLASLFALSFAIFTVYQSGTDFLLGFGGKGILTFVRLFPWWTTLLSICLLLVLETLLRNFRFVWQLPLLRLFLYTLLGAVAGSILLAASPFHPFLLDRADRGELPLFGSLYQEVHTPHWQQGFYRGYVTATTTENFTISHSDRDLDSDDGAWTILPPSGFDMRDVRVGDKAYVAGEYENGAVHAYGIQLENAVK